LHFQRDYAFPGGLDGGPAGAPIFRSPFSSAVFGKPLGLGIGKSIPFPKIEALAPYVVGAFLAQV
jgi:hypothetical protein